MFLTDKRTLWKFWIDRGGTFTDIVAKSPVGGVFQDSCRLKFKIMPPHSSHFPG